MYAKRVCEHSQHIIANVSLDLHMRLIVSVFKNVRMCVRRLFMFVYICTYIYNNVKARVCTYLHGYAYVHVCACVGGSACVRVGTVLILLYIKRLHTMN